MPGEQGVACFVDVVNSNHVGTLCGDGDSDSDCAERTFFERAAEDLGEEAFTGVPDQDGAIEFAQDADV